jgi:hypothetical protein
MQSKGWAAAWSVLFSTAALAQPFLHLKSRTIDPAAAVNWLETRDGVQAQTVSGDLRQHVLIQLDRALDLDLLSRLNLRGVRLLGSVPDNGYVASVPVNAALEDLGVTWAGALQATDKLSPFVDPAAERVTVLIELHADVEPAATRLWLQDQGWLLREHSRLRPHQLWAEGPGAAAPALAELDEVAYVFAAAAEFGSGDAVAACLNASVGLLHAAAVAASTGAGWDGPGRGAAALTYSFGELTTKLPADQIRTAVQRALAEWARYAKLSFTETRVRTSQRNIDILFAGGAHGDPFPFDGPGRVLAHTYFPAPPNLEPIAGDMHFDDAENWRLDGDIDFQSVALHEVGHALGLAHLDDPNSVMYAFYRRKLELQGADIAALLELYASVDLPGGGGNPPPPPPTVPLTLTLQATPAVTNEASLPVSGTVDGGQGEVRVTWGTDRGASGTAAGGRAWTVNVPLASGRNVLTVVATDARNVEVRRSVSLERRENSMAPTLTITEPAGNATVSTNRVTLRGIASHPSGIDRVTWRNSRGGAGSATGTSSWAAGPIDLQPGANVLTLDAVSRDGNAVSRSVTVTLPNAPPGADTTPPTLLITSPAAASLTTSAADLRILGTASDAGGIARVTWSTATQSGEANGSTHWQTPPIPLLVGINNITIRAFDNAGNSSWRSVTVTRR